MRWRGNLFLLLAAFLWGTTFVAQSLGMERIGPFTYMAARFFLGAAALFALWLYTREERMRARAAGQYAGGWRPGFAAGGIMFAAAALQQYGLQYTTVGKASFLTCLYLVFVPLAGVFLRQRLQTTHIAGSVLALAGLYFLCVKEGLTLGSGDQIVLACAFFWTGHILFIGRYAARADVIEMSLAQVIATMLLSFLAALAFETWVWADVLGAWVAIAYGGILSTGVAFTLQSVGQKYAAPAPAAILMSLESVFGALAGWIVLGQALSPREILGCVLMGAGMLASQADVLAGNKQNSK